MKEVASLKVKTGLAEMLKGEVIMDACAIMAIERVPSDIRGAGGIATPADAALMMQLGFDGIFVGSDIFKSVDPVKRAKAIVLATTNYNDPQMLAEISKDLGEAMSGIEISTLKESERMQERGW